MPIFGDAGSALVQGVRVWFPKRKRREDGAVALEAALVTPILLILVFGIIEFSFALRDYVVVVSDSRVGARIASTGAGFGPQKDCSTDETLPCVPDTVPLLAQAAARAIQRSGSAMPMENINYILIYKANEQGYPGVDGNKTMPSSCPSNCVKFAWRPGKDPDVDGEFKYAGGSWPSRSISACFPENLDRVGVYVDTTHEGLTGFFFKNLNISDHAVMNFEPLATSICGSGGPGNGGHS